MARDGAGVSRFCSWRSTVPECRLFVCTTIIGTAVLLVAMSKSCARATWTCPRLVCTEDSMTLCARLWPLQTNALLFRTRFNLRTMLTRSCRLWCVLRHSCASVSASPFGGGAPCNTKAVQAGDCPSPNDIQVSPDSSHPTWKSSGQTIWSPRSTKPQKRVRYLQFVRAADDAPSTNLGRQLAVGFQDVNVLLREVRHLSDNLTLVSYWLSWRSRPNSHFQQFRNNKDLQ